MFKLSLFKMTLNVNGAQLAMSQIKETEKRNHLRWSKNPKHNTLKNILKKSISKNITNKKNGHCYNTDRLRKSKKWTKKQQYEQINKCTYIHKHDKKKDDIQLEAEAAAKKDQKK